MQVGWIRPRTSVPLNGDVGSCLFGCKDIGVSERGLNLLQVRLSSRFFENHLFIEAL
jgi:hypothetical protein